MVLLGCVSQQRPLTWSLGRLVADVFRSFGFEFELVLSFVSVC